MRRTTGRHALRLLARRILEWAHQGFLGRADRACYYLLGTHMDARREPDYYAILDRQAHPLVVTRVYRLRAALYHPDNKEKGDTERFRRVKRTGSATRSGGPRMTGAVPLIVLGELPGCSVGEAQFILWYLRGKRLIEQTEDRGGHHRRRGGLRRGQHLGTGGRRGDLASLYPRSHALASHYPPVSHPRAE